MVIVRLLVMAMTTRTLVMARIKILAIVGRMRILEMVGRMRWMKKIGLDVLRVELNQEWSVVSYMGRKIGDSDPRFGMSSTKSVWLVLLQKDSVVMQC
jgi:hypothetical protein